MPQIGLLIYLAGICLPVQIVESYMCVSQRIRCELSHLTHCTYVSGPYWSVCDWWQIIHVKYAKNEN